MSGQVGILADEPQCGIAVQLGHLNIHEDQIGTDLVDLGERLFSVDRLRNLESMRRQGIVNEFAALPAVVGDEDSLTLRLLTFTHRSANPR